MFYHEVELHTTIIKYRSVRGGQEIEAGRRERRREWRSEAAGRAETSVYDGRRARAQGGCFKQDLATRT